MAPTQTATTLSWRDPDGFVINVGGRILRAVVKSKAAQVKLLLESPWIGELIKDGSMPRTVSLSDSPTCVDESDAWDWLEHDVLSFPCYPHEISALQLYDSAQLTLRIAILAAQNGWALKDASAWNILHDGGRPVFVDILSFERRTAGNAWIAYGQFVRHFILPLMAYRECGITPAEIFLLNRDGLTPERTYELLGGTSLLSTAAMEFVMLPRWLAPAGARRIAVGATTVATSAARAGAVQTGTVDGARPPAALAPGGMDLMLQTLRRLQRKLTKLRPELAGVKSVWKEYEEERSHYSDADIQAKKGFVSQHLGGTESVLDLGCNAGEFSLLAADLVKSVVSTDFDHAALSRLYERIRNRRTAVAPLMLNIARPTPAVGWQNREVAGFLDRAAGHFDCILALGLIHHLIVSERCSLPMLVDLLDRLNPRRIIVEWIEPSDPRFRQVAGLNADLYRHLNSDIFEASLASKFQLQEKSRLPCGTRVMYLWTRDYNCNINV